MDLRWQDDAIPGKKLKKPSRTPEEVSQAKKQYEQKRSRSFKLLFLLIKSKNYISY
jgi:predicted nucleic acid-binding Zn ribbon protein